MLIELLLFSELFASALMMLTEQQVKQLPQVSCTQFAELACVEVAIWAVIRDGPHQT